MTFPHVDVGSMRLYSSIRPGLQAGTYRVDLDQKFAGAGEAVPGVTLPDNMEVPTVVKHFEVTGPRFSLPGTEIHSVFPPPNAVGPFHNKLPHIALKRRTLPWERAGDDDNPELPWLALVILTDGEANFMRNVNIEDALPSAVLANVAERGTCDVIEVTEDIVEQVFPREDEFEYLLHVRQVNVDDTENAGDDEDGFMAVVMANRLPRLGHAYGAYLISVEHRYQELPDPNPTDFTDTVGQVSVYAVSADLLFEASYSMGGGATSVDFKATAQPSTLKNVAGSQVLHYPTASVSTAAGEVTEIRKSGWHQKAQPRASGSKTRALPPGADDATDLIAGEATEAVQTGQATSAAFSNMMVVHDVDFAVIAPAAKKVRYPVLAHWQFTCSDGLDFRELMQALDVAMLGSPPRGSDPALFPLVADTGHAQIDHTNRGGEKGIAWYRGPFTPREVARRATSAPFHTADQARTVGGDHIENLSEAAAFEVGRMLALADPSFLQELLRWRRDGFRLLKTASLLGKFGYGDLLVDDLYATNIGRVLTLDLLGGMAAKGLAGLGPLIDPALGIELFDDDVKVIAEGFATPIDRVRNAVGVGKELTTPGAEIGFAPSPEVTSFDALVEVAAEELNHLWTDLENRVEDIASNAAPRQDDRRDRDD